MSEAPADPAELADPLDASDLVDRADLADLVGSTDSGKPARPREPTDPGDAGADATADADDDAAPDDAAAPDDDAAPDDGDLAGAPRHRPRRIRLNRLVQTWVPEPLRDARIDPGRRGALVLLLVAALAAVATAVGVWRDRPVPRPVQPVAMAPVSDSVAAGDPPPGAQARPGSGTGSAADPGRLGTGPPRRDTSPSGGTGVQPPPVLSAAPAELAVSVTGLVKRPGLVRVPDGSRVADAIAAAGGVTDTADITGLNLAAVLTDGDSVVVGGAVATGSIAGQGPAASGSTRTGQGTGGAGGSGNPDAVVDLNTADQAALEELPGVGPVMAGNILSWRETNGAFTSVDQLQEVTGIGPARFAQLQPLVRAGPAP